MAAQQVLPHMVHRYDCLSLRIAVVLCVLTPPPVSLSLSPALSLSGCVFFFLMPFFRFCSGHAFTRLLARYSYQLCHAATLRYLCALSCVRVCVNVSCTATTTTATASGASVTEFQRFWNFNGDLLPLPTCRIDMRACSPPLPPLSVSLPLSLHVCVSVLRYFLVVAPRKNRWCDDQNKSQKQQQQQQHPQVNGDRYFSLSL